MRRSLSVLTLAVALTAATAASAGSAAVAAGSPTASAAVVAQTTPSRPVLTVGTGPVTLTVPARTTKEYRFVVPEGQTIKADFGATVVPANRCMFGAGILRGLDRPQPLDAVCLARRPKTLSTQATSGDDYVLELANQTAGRRSVTVTLTAIP